MTGRPVTSIGAPRELVVKRHGIAPQLEAVGHVDIRCGKLRRRLCLAPTLHEGIAVDVVRHVGQRAGVSELERLSLIHNNAGSWPTVEVQRQSTVTYLEQYDKKQGPDYIRIIGGRLKRWGLCLYFFDKNGRLMNDDILDHSDEYQIFFTVSDVDDKGQPYEVTDTRGTWHAKYDEYDTWQPGGTIDHTPVPSPFFANKTTWKERADATPKIFEYTYRDTWIHDAMGDGARELFNQRLLPPLTRKEADWAVAPYDQDRVGLKGHFNFDIDADENDDKHKDWPLEITRRTDPTTGKGGRYTRPSFVLPKFYLSVRVMKCPKGKKALIPKDPYLARHSTYVFLSSSSAQTGTTPTSRRIMALTRSGRMSCASTSLSRSSAAASTPTPRPLTPMTPTTITSAVRSASQQRKLLRLRRMSRRTASVVARALATGSSNHIFTK